MTNSLISTSWESQIPVTADVLARVNEQDSKKKQYFIERIKQELERQNAVLVAHYYTDAALQQLADETGGCVADSLEMARFGKASNAEKIIVAGVRFMGETAKILSPEKRVFMPDLNAECSLDLGCPANEFSDFCDQHPQRVVVVYANTSAEVKARADWVVTSAIATEVVAYLHQQGKKILWAPDRHLGRYIQHKTGADMLLWQGSCVVHNEFKAEAMMRLMKKHPQAKVLVHPESAYTLVEMADVVGSTTQLINAVKQLDAPEFIVATDNGIFYKMQQAMPDKKLIEVPTGGAGATCTMCAHCSWMAMNSLAGVERILTTEENEIFIEENIRRKAYQATQRLLDFASQHRKS